MGGTLTKVDLGHGRGWLAEPAALSIERIDAELGHPIQITEAGRTWAQQKAHWDTYQRDGKPIALHPDAPSIHQLGHAIDTDERNLPVLHDHGWKQTVYRNGRLVEPWHFEYDPTRDNHLGEDPMPTPEEIAKAVWNYSMHGGSEMSGGDKVPQETAGERLRHVRRSTDRLRARTLASTSRLRELVDAGKLTQDTLDEVLTILEAEE